jgi:hypothetical protein
LLYFFLNKKLASASLVKISPGTFPCCNSVFYLSIMPSGPTDLTALSEKLTILDTDDDDSDYLIIGLDFGTTYSGLVIFLARPTVVISYLHDW